MGIVLSYFRKEESIEKTLERLEKQLAELQDAHNTVRERWRLWITNLVIWTLLFEIVYFIVYYLMFYGKIQVTHQDNAGYVQLGEEKVEWWMKNIAYVSPLLLIPVLAIIFRRVINYWFGKSISGHESKLKKLQEEQKQKLEELAQSTNFYKTQELMNKYSKDKKNVPAPKPQPQKANSGLPATPQDTERLLRMQQQEIMRLRAFMQQQQRQSQLQSQPSQAPTNPNTQKNESAENRQSGEKSNTPVTPNEAPRYVMPVPRDRLAAASSENSQNPPAERPRPGNMTWYDSVIDYLVGPEYSQSPTVPRSKSGPSTKSGTNLTDVSRNLAAEEEEENVEEKSTEEKKKD